MKKQFTLSKFLLPVFLLSISCSLSAQDSPLTQIAPHTSVGTAYACPGSTITVPVIDSGFKHIYALELQIVYDSTIMTYNHSLIAPNPSLGYINNNSLHIPGHGSLCAVRLEWSSAFGDSLPDGSTLATIGFNYINGTSPLYFLNTDTSGTWDSFYDGSTYFPLNDMPTATYYHSGQISSGFVGGTVSGSSNITFGSPTGTLILNGYVGNVIKWQKQLNGGGYVDISNTNPTYSTTPDTTGVWNYRAVVQYGSCPQAFSTPATDTVTAVNHLKTWTGAASINWKNSLNWIPYGIPM